MRKGAPLPGFSASKGTRELAFASFTTQGLPFMLYDRSYMRDTNPTRSSLPVFGWVLVVIAAYFVLNQLSEKLFRSGILFDLAALRIQTLKQGRIWNLFSYALLHANFLHILCNALALFFIGRILEPILGARRLLWTLGWSIFGGSVLWVTLWEVLRVSFGYNQYAPLVGISAGAMGWFSIFCFLFWDRPITLLLFFVIPIRIKPCWLFYITGGLELLGMVSGEILRGGTFYGSGIAHSAHVGGILAGWLFYHFKLRYGDEERHLRPTIEKPSWFKRLTNSTAPKPVYKVNVSSKSSATSPTEMRAEVDRILDKINGQGFSSLTDEEKRTLDDARDMISRR